MRKNLKELQEQMRRSQARRKRATRKPAAVQILEEDAARVDALMDVVARLKQQRIDFTQESILCSTMGGMNFGVPDTHLRSRQRRAPLTGMGI